MLLRLPFVLSAVTCIVLHHAHEAPVVVAPITVIEDALEGVLINFNDAMPALHASVQQLQTVLLSRWLKVTLCGTPEEHPPS